MIKRSALCKIIIGGTLLFSGCAGLQPARPIAAGEKMQVNFSCGITGKGLVTTTIESVAQDKSVEKSKAFAGRIQYQPVDIIAGKAQGQEPEELKLLEPEILFHIAEQAPGKLYNTPYDMVLNSELSPTIQDNNRYRMIKRVRYVPKIRTVSPRLYAQKNIPVPKAGEIEKAPDGTPHAKILAVTDTEIKKELIINPGHVLPIDCGDLRTEPGKDDDTVKVIIDSEVGRLVRTGPIIGRVVEVTGKQIKIDYGHPFAGFPLQCRVQFLEKESGEKQ